MTNQNKSMSLCLLEGDFSEANRIFKSILSEKVVNILESANVFVANTAFLSEKTEDEECECDEKDKDEKDSEEVEEENLEELSKDSLGNYIKKASKSARQNEGEHEYLTRYNDKKSADRRAVLNKKIKKRTKGIDKAVSRLTKESVEDLEELSKDSLASYIKKASKNARQRGIEAEYLSGVNRGTNVKKSHDDHIRKIKNRDTGFATATKKLTKESVEDFQEGKLPWSQYLKATGHDKKKVPKHVHDYFKNHYSKSQDTNDFETNHGDHMKNEFKSYQKESVESIEELSKDSLASYIKKADKELDKHRNSTGNFPFDKNKSEKDIRNFKNRYVGIHTAIRKYKAKSAKE